MVLSQTESEIKMKEYKQPMGIELAELNQEVSSEHEMLHFPRLDLFMVPDPQRPHIQWEVKRVIIDYENKKLLLLPD